MVRERGTANGPGMKPIWKVPVKKYDLKQGFLQRRVGRLWRGAWKFYSETNFFNNFYIWICVSLRLRISNFFLTDGFPLPFVLRFFFKKSPLICRANATTEKGCGRTRSARPKLLAFRPHSRLARQKHLFYYFVSTQGSILFYLLVNSNGAGFC